MIDQLKLMLARLRECRRLLRVASGPVRVFVQSPPCLPKPAAERGLPLQEVLRLGCEVLDIAPFSVVDAPFARASTLERIVAQQLQLDSIWGALQDGLVPRASALQALAAVEEKYVGTEFRRHVIVSARGARLVVHEVGDRSKPCWLMVLPYGIPAELTYGLASAVRARYHFVTFEGPDMGLDVEHFDTLSHGIEESASDILAVMDHFELSRAHVAGLCAGVVPTLLFAHQNPARVQSLILGNGAYESRSNATDDFIGLVDRVGGNREKAAVFLRFMSSQNTAGLESECPHYTMLPYCNPDLLYMFTTCFKRFYAHDFQEEMATWLGSISCPTLVALGECDTIAPPAGSRRVADRIRNSRLLVDPQGTHLSLLRAPTEAMNAAMLEFCAQSDALFGASVAASLEGAT